MTLPTHEERVGLLDRVLEFGLHEQRSRQRGFSSIIELIEDFRESTRDRVTGEAAEDLSAHVYELVIQKLIHLAAPPSRENLAQALSMISDLTSQNVQSVQIEHENGVQFDLRRALPPGRELSPDEIGAVLFFAEQLGGDDAKSQ